MKPKSMDSAPKGGPAKEGPIKGRCPECGAMAYPWDEPRFGISGRRLKGTWRLWKCKSKTCQWEAPRYETLNGPRSLRP